MTFSTKYIQEDDMWAVIDSAGNHVSYFIQEREAHAYAAKLRVWGDALPVPHVCHGVNYRPEDFYID